MVMGRRSQRVPIQPKSAAVVNSTLMRARMVMRAAAAKDALMVPEKTRTHAAFRAAQLQGSSAEELRGVLGEIGDDEVCAGATHADERLQNSAVAFEPAFLKGGLQH